LNRIDEIVLFHGLERSQLRQITELMLEDVRRRLHAQGVSLDVSDDAKDWLANKGYQPEFGARPLRRVIQREVDRQLSRMLLGGELSPGQTVQITTRDGRLEFNVTGEPEARDERS